MINLKRFRNHIDKVQKREGEIVSFDRTKIEEAIFKALTASGEGGRKLAKELSLKVLKLLNRRFKKGEIPNVEQIQDIVEEVLILENLVETAKDYILYREQRRLSREAKVGLQEAISLVDDYFLENNWEVKENSNMAFSLQGLNHYVSAYISKKYWLNRIYPQEVRKAAEEGDLHIHNLDILGAYCCGWDLYDVLLRGFGGVFGKIQSKPPKHFRTALGQVVNYFYTLQGESAGAQAFSNFDTLLAPFIRYDNLNYREIKQALQEFMFNCNVPTRVGFQCISEDTEILTPNGWKNYQEVKKGDIIETFNLKTKALEEKRVSYVFKKNYKGVMYRLRNRIQDQLISPRHRVVRRKFYSDEYHLEPIEEVIKLKSPFIIPIAGENIRPDVKLSDEQIKLMAWIISEGTIEHEGKHRTSFRVSIYQSPKKNNKNYKEIISLLKHFKFKYSEYKLAALGDEVSRLRLNAKSSKTIHQWFNSKENVHFIPEILTKLSKRQSRLFLDTYLKGDGFEGCKISTTDLEILDGLETICINAGYGFTVLKRKPTIGTKDIYVLRIIKHPETYIQRIEKVNYQGIIWSVHTSNETVIARRNGKVFITGNTPFTNITLDLKVPEHLKEMPVIIGGQPQKETYKEFQKEMDIFNQALTEVYLEGDATGRVFTFPIPTYNITKDFDWENENYNGIWQMTAKYGIPYFSNFINSEMKPEDARSMCPLAGDEKVLIKSSRGRRVEFSTIRNIYEGNSKQEEYEIYSDGKFIKGRFNKFNNQRMIKVTLENGHEIKISDEHLNFVMTKPEGKELVLKGKELKPDMYLPYSLNIYKGEGGNRDLGYFVGCYAGDGSLDQDTAVVFSLENYYKKEVIEKLRKISKDYFGTEGIVKSDKKSKLVTLKIYSKAAVGLCRDFVEGKERNKHYTAKLFIMSEEFRRGVLSGHYATDGGNRNRIYTSSWKMVESLNMLAATLGTTTSIYKDERKNRFGKEPNYAVLVYQSNRKKYGKIWFKKGKKLWMKIKKIEPIQNNTAYCFEVKRGNKPIFTVGTTGILTHNCRLRLDNRELYKRGGGLFGANPLTGSIGVVTINLPRIGYLSKTKKEFFENLSRLMDLAKTSLEIKRKVLEKWTEKGLYPYSKYYLEGVKKMRGSYWGNHFSTIGIIGMNEALLNFMDVNIADKKGQEFALEVLDFMRERLVKYQEETGNLYNLEATPAEGTSYRLALLDKKRYPEIITAGEKEPFYTNSTQLPVNYTDDLFEALKLQDELQTKYTGGCVEKGNKVLTDKGLIKIEEIVKNFEKLKPLKVISYNLKKGISEWDEVVDAVEIDVKKHNKIRIIAEGGLDITTSDWHPFFVLEKIKPNPHCPICGYKVNNLKGFAVHLRYHPDCHLAYETMPKYKIVEKRADELKKGDYLLINSFNLLKEEKSNLNKDLMWLIGFFMGDGSISKVIDNRGGNHLEKYIVRFFFKHLESLEKVKNILNHYFNCNVNIIQDDKRSEKLRCVSTSKKEVSKFFFDYGFSYGEKTYKISIPEKVKKNITKENIYSLLSGLAESDGHISKKQGDFEYYTVSEKLADDLLEILTISGIKVSKSLKKTRRKNEKNLYRIRIPSYEMTKIKDYFNDFYLSFKIKDKLSNRIKRQLPVLRVKKVSKTEVSDNLFYDLTTKNNHNYLAGKNTFVFIHNTVFHAFLGEAISDPKSVKSLIKTIFEKFKLPYFTLTPTFSVCPVHGYLPGEHFTCPKCLVEQPCEVYSRIVGYLRPVQQWHFGKQEEFRLRKNFKIN